MARRDIDSNGPNGDAKSYNTVFVDTSLDTHLVLIISSSDTVSDFKKKILVQHSESFPRVGGVKIHSVQVKRQGHFYHLPDSMLVSSAFDGSKKTWFLFVEASRSVENDKEQPSHKLDDASENCSLLYLQNHSQGNHHNVPADDHLKLASEEVPQAVQGCLRNFSGEISRDIDMEVEHLKDDCQKELSSDIDKSLAPPGATLEKNITVSENAAPSEAEARDNNKTTVVSGLDALPSAVKKHKIEHIENAGFTTKKKHKADNKKDSLVDASGEVPSDMQTRKIVGELYDTFSSDANWMSISGGRRTLEFETNVEQSGKFEREEVYRDRPNSPTGEHVSKEEKVPSLQEVKEDNLVTGVASKKEKKKQKKTLSVPHDQVTTSEPNSVLCGSVSRTNLNTEAPEANKNSGYVELVDNEDPKVMVSKRCKPLDEVEADVTNKESIPSPNFVGTSSPTEAVDSIRTKMKKKRTKKKAQGSAGEGTNITGAVSSTVADLAPKDLTDDNIINDQSMLSLDESQKNNGIEKQRVLSHNLDPQVQSSGSFKPSDQDEAQEISKGSIFSPNLSLVNGVAEAGSSGTSKRKKGKAKKSAAKFQDKSDTDNLHETSLPAQGVVLDVEMNDETAKKNKTVPHIENELKNDRELSSTHGPEVVFPKGNKLLDSGKAKVNDKESDFAETSLDDKRGVEAGKSGRSHKKKRVKRPPTTNDDFSPMEHSNPVSASPAKHFEGDGGLSLNHGPEVISSKGSKNLDLGEATVDRSESGFAAQTLDNEDGFEAGKSGGGEMKKKAKKYVNSLCDSPAKHFASEAQGQATFSCTERNKKPKEESRDASISRASKANKAGKSRKIISSLAENDRTSETAKDLNDNLREAKNDQSTDTSALQDRPVKLQANELQHLQHDETDNEQENAENIRKKVKKTNRKQNNAAATQSNSKAKGQNINIEELAASGDKLGDGDHPHDTVNKSVPAETISGNRSAVLELMPKKNARVESKSLNPEEALKGGDLSEVPSSHTIENNMEGRPEMMTNIKNIVETSKAGDEGINFRHYFLPEQHQTEDASANKGKGALHSTEAKRKRKKPNFVSDGTLKLNQQRHNRSNTNDHQPVESSADAKGNEVMARTNKEIPQASGNVVKASESHDVDKKKTPQKAAKPVIANGFGSSRNTPSWLEENNGSVTASSSSSSTKGSKRAFQDTTNKMQQSGSNNGGTSARKFSSKNDRDIVNSSQQQKSLLSAPGAIFSDDSSESSGNENQTGNSDASTRTPSDNSSSSGYSDDESKLSRDSRGNGSENAKMKDGGRRSTLNSKFPDPKDMSMDMILRSSKRFKKAKLTASQSQGADTESQPVDFVPDSQAN